jgi:hypothetical protein
MKIFTGTEKWLKPWFRNLSPLMKCVINYLWENCDKSGVWEVDMEAMRFDIGDNSLDYTEILKELFHQVMEIKPGELWLIPDWVSFQYKELGVVSSLHKNVIRDIEKRGLFGYLRGTREAARSLDVEIDWNSEKLNSLEKFYNKDFYAIAMPYLCHSHAIGPEGPGPNVNVKVNVKIKEKVKVKKEEKEFPGEVVEIVEMFNQTLPENLRRPGDVKWMECIVLLTDRHGYKFDDIKEIIRVFRDPESREGEFWISNFLTLSKLSRKDKDGTKYIDRFLTKLNRGNGKQISTVDTVEAAEEALLRQG